MASKLLGIVSAVLVVPLAHAADKAGCRDPAWAPHRLPGFEIRGCESRPWRMETLSLPGGDKRVEGKETSVTYELTDEKLNPTAAKARSFYADQAKAAGAALASSPGDGYAAYSVKKTAGGEAWYLYDHGSGNEQSTGSFTLRTVEPAPFPQEVEARGMPGEVDLPTPCAAPTWLVKAPAKFKLKDCERKDWASHVYDLPGGDQRVEGRRYTVHYELQDSDDSVYPPWLQRNFVNALTRAGWTLKSPPERASEAFLTQKTPKGEFWIVYEQGGGNGDETQGFSLTTYQVQPLAQVITARTSTGPVDPASPRCDGAPWVTSAYPRFKVRDCEGRAWDRLEVRTADGDQTVEGRRLTVRYELTSDKDAPVGPAVSRNHARALQKIGAKLLSSPDEGNRAVLSQKLPFGEVWYLYEQAGGNSEWVSGYDLTTVDVGPLPQEIVAQPVKAALDTKRCTPPWLVTSFPYFKQERCDNRDFDQVELSLADGTRKVAGTVLETDYALADPHRTPTALAVQLNFINALKKIGAQQVSDPKAEDEAVFRQTTPAGDLWYVYEQRGGNAEEVGAYRLLTIGPGSPVACKMEIYGLNFDFDKATLRPDSEPVLRTLLAMFQRDPNASGELSGHTDNVGKPAYNQKLSGERAGAVKAWLVAHGIAPSRITTRGYGQSRPLVPNTSDENRAKNRRVELQRKDCRK